MEYGILDNRTQGKVIDKLKEDLKSGTKVSIKCATACMFFSSSKIQEFLFIKYFLKPFYHILKQRKRQG